MEHRRQVRAKDKDTAKRLFSTLGYEVEHVVRLIEPPLILSAFDILEEG